MYCTIFYVFIFSLIPHKEDRFLLPVVAFCLLALGYLLVRKAKVWKGGVKCLAWTLIIVELVVQAAYHVHHKLWIFTDHILAKADQDPGYYPHSFYTMRRFDQPWYSLFHNPDPKKRTQIYLSQQNPDWFRRKYHTNLNLALDREN